MVRPNGSIMPGSFAPAYFVKIRAQPSNVAPDLVIGRSCYLENQIPCINRWVDDLPQDSARSIFSHMQEFTVRPQPDDPRLTRSVTGIDHEGRTIATAVVMERPLTLF